MVMMTNGNNTWRGKDCCLYKPWAIKRIIKSSHVRRDILSFMTNACAQKFKCQNFQRIKNTQNCLSVSSASSNARASLHILVQVNTYSRAVCVEESRAHFSTKLYHRYSWKSDAALHLNMCSDKLLRPCIYIYSDTRAHPSASAGFLLKCFPLEYIKLTVIIRRIYRERARSRA
jgi:hypothetical protein